MGTDPAGAGLVVALLRELGRRARFLDSQIGHLDELSSRSWPSGPRACWR